MFQKKNYKTQTDRWQANNEIVLCELTLEVEPTPSKLSSREVAALPSHGSRVGLFSSLQEDTGVEARNVLASYSASRLRLRLLETPTRGTSPNPSLLLGPGEQV